MKTETEKLAVLVDLSLRKQPGIPVNSTEIDNAFDAIQSALWRMPLHSMDPMGAKNNLQKAAHVLCYFIYCMEDDLLHNFSGNKKCFLTKACHLYEKIADALNCYCNGAPVRHPFPSSKKLMETLIDIDNTLSKQEPIASLYAVLQPCLCEVQKARSLSFNRWMWWCRFSGMAVNTVFCDLQTFEDLLITLNFNTPRFIHRLSANIHHALDSKGSVAEKAAFITEQFLKYTTMDSVENGYVLAEKQVKEMMCSVLEMQLRCLDAFSIQKHDQVPSKAIKINTVLPVSQLALFIRLLTDTKIINETNTTALLKHIAGVVYTSRAATISPESLRVNYYTPNTAANNILKDYLVNMLNLLKTYQ